MSKDAAKPVLKHGFKRPSVDEQRRIVEVTSQLPNSHTNAPVVVGLPQLVTKNVHSYKDLAVGQVFEAPIKDLKKNPYNARQTSSPTTLEELANSLAVSQDTSALAFVSQSGELCLIDGHRRLDSCALNGKDTLRIEVRPEPQDDQSLYLYSRRANKEREDQSPLDDALAWKLLFEKKIFSTQRELAAKLEIEENVFSNIYSLAELPKTIIRFLVDRPSLLNLRMLTAIRLYWKITDDDATEQLIIDIEKNNFSSRDVDAKRNAIKTGKATRVRGVSTPMSYSHGTALLKRFPEKGKLNIEISEIKDEERMELLYKKIYEALAEALGDIEKNI